MPVGVSPVNVADPFEAVVAVALLGVAPAGLTVAVTTTPLWLTRLPLASWSWSTGCWANATPLCAALDGAVVSASFVAAPAVPSAVKVTGLPVTPDPAAVAVSVFVPTVVLRVQLPTVAIPLPFVVWVPPVTLPLPAAGAKVTVTPCTGLPLPSCTITDGGEPTALPAGADCVVGLLAAITAAAPADRKIAVEGSGGAVAAQLSTKQPTVPV